MFRFFRKKLNIRKQTKDAVFQVVVIRHYVRYSGKMIVVDPFRLFLSFDLTPERHGVSKLERVIRALEPKLKIGKQIIAADGSVIGTLVSFEAETSEAED